MTRETIIGSHRLVGIVDEMISQSTILEIHPQRMVVVVSLLTFSVPLPEVQD